MKRVSFASAAIVLALCSLPVHAQERVLGIADSRFSTYDIGALKAGDWVEYSFDNAGQKLSYRFACVAIEDDVVFIEYSDKALTMWYPGTVVLAAVNKSDRKVTKAWWGKPGEKGQEIKVKATLAVGKKGDLEKGKMSKEKVTVAGKEVDAEKLELETTVKLKDGDRVVKRTSWVAGGLPFKGSVEGQADPGRILRDVEWEGDRPHEGTLVKSVDTFGTLVLTGFGTDAKQTLQK